MFKYVKFNTIQDELTKLEFRGGGEDVKVNYFDTGVVSLEGTKSDINAIISKQDPKINCVEITIDEFREIASSSRQLERIRKVVAADVAKQYSLADEIGMLKREETDPKRVAYEAYVAECKAKGDEAKAKMGY